jgi:septal ring factor EnvC (AmiA/AmiB activator)
MATSKGSGACRTIVQLRLTDSAAASVSDEHKSTSLEADIEKKVDKARLELKEAQNALDNSKSELKESETKLKNANAELKAAKTESEINRANQAVDRANEGVDTSQSFVTSCTKRVIDLMQRLTRLESAASGTSLYYSGLRQPYSFLLQGLIRRVLPRRLASVLLCERFLDCSLLSNQVGPPQV